MINIAALVVIYLVVAGI